MQIDISKFDQCKVLVVGDVMIDEYVWGEVDRISPEAPVQIVSVVHEDYTLGGAGNVVNNLAALGARVSVAGVIGTGRAGQLFIEKCKELGVNIEGLFQEPDRPTTRKTRIIAASQHVLRIDRETNDTISARAFETLTEFIEGRIPDFDVVLISDYGKGFVTKTLLSKLIAAARKHQKITIADPKGLDFAKYTGVSLLTPNKKEATLASGIEIVDESTLRKAGNRILEIAAIDNLLITCGKEGMILLERNKEAYQIMAEARQVYDVSGAGDTVIAVLGLAAASGASFKESAQLANTAAGIVVGKVGTATVSREELAAAMKTY